MSAARLLAAVTVIALLALSATGCESTQDKSRRLAKENAKITQEKGVTVSTTSRDVVVVSKTVLTDANGSAVAVELRNKSKRGLLGVPVAINVTDAKGVSVFKNDTPGLEPSLVRAPLLSAGVTLTWVNDQVLATGKPKAVAVRVGAETKTAPAKIPNLEIVSAKLENDPVDGVLASGKVVNHSSVEQRQLIIFGVARKGGKIVAAGRAAIPRLAPGKKVGFAMFFVGNPRGAKLELVVPPTVFG
ncbi:MAG: hypothetical protein WCK06_08415 [Actinomycetota bacterium]